MTRHTPDNSSAAKGSLYVVATPIGNLADMVPRAVETLQTVALIAAEDTRHSARLLNHFAIDTPCVAYHDHSDEARTRQLLERLQAGEDLALISDAGTPLISDPGYRLVRSAREAGIRVIPVPGPCALIAALSASGLASDRFIFEGFLPAKSAARRERLDQLASEERTLIFYEAPHRIKETLADLVEIFGADRELVMARELTKTFETIKSAQAAELLAWVDADKDQERGEIVLLAQGAPRKSSQGLDTEAERLMKILLEELPVKQAAALAAKITGLKKNQLYQWALDAQPDKKR
jgi:16S rRNA (cytidine1402-2'-O)-methyltransferase